MGLIDAVASMQRFAGEMVWSARGMVRRGVGVWLAVLEAGIDVRPEGYGR